MKESSSGIILVLISYGSVLMLPISIISVMECTPRPLVLMAASVMEPHCIAAKSWLNNLPLLRLERPSQLFNDVSMLEGCGAHRFAHAHDRQTLTRSLEDRLTGTCKHARARDKRNVSVIRRTAEVTPQEGNPKMPLSKLKWLHAACSCVVSADCYCIRTSPVFCCVTDS